MHKTKPLRLGALLAASAITGCAILPWPSILGPTSGSEDLPHAERRTAIPLEDGLHVSWSESGILAQPNFGDPLMVAFPEAVVVLALEGKDPLDQVLAYDPLDGAFLWSAWPGRSSAIAKTNRGLAVGTRDGVVALHNPLSGEAIWTVTIGGGGILHLIAAGDLVYAYSRQEEFSLIDLATGTILPAPDLFGLPYPFLITPTDMYGLFSRSGIQDIDPSNGMQLWAKDLGEVYFETPLIVGDSICIRSGRELGRISCLDRRSGDPLWESEDDIVSNAAAFEGSLLALARGGTIDIFRLSGGSRTSVASFDPGPFVVAGEGDAGGYYVAADEKEGRVYVLLGDSGQMMGLAP